MRKVRVIAASRLRMQQEIDEFLEKIPDQIFELKPGGLNEQGYAICYIIYEDNNSQSFKEAQMLKS
jgi:hypothetical protein